MLISFLQIPLVVRASGEGTNESAKEETITYGSWIDDTSMYTDVYGEVEVKEDGVLETAYEAFRNAADNTFSSISWLANIFNVLFVFLGWLIDGFISGGNGKVDHVDLSLDSVIYGRVIDTVDVNFVTWELETNNIYGITSATFYRFFANVGMSVLVIMIFWTLLRSALHTSTARDRITLKDTLSYSLVVFLFLYIIPNVADVGCYIRDWVLLNTYQLASGQIASGVDSLSKIYLAAWWDVGDGGGGIVYALLYLATCCAGLIFAINYIKTAVKQTILFSLFPVFAILSIKNRKLMSAWITEFFTNLFIPVIDGMLILLPMALMRLAKLNGWTTVFGGGLELGISFVMVIMIFSVMPMRKQLLRILGNMTGDSGSRGLGGIMSAAMMGFRMFSGRGSGIISGIEGYGGGGSLALAAADNMNMANMFNAEALAQGQSAMETSSAINQKFADFQNGELGREVESAVADTFEEYTQEHPGSLGASADTGIDAMSIDDTSEINGGIGADIAMDEEAGGAFVGDRTAEFEDSSYYGSSDYESFDSARRDNLSKMDTLNDQIEGLQETNDNLAIGNSYDRSLMEQYSNVCNEMGELSKHGDSGIVIDSSGTTQESARYSALSSEKTSLENRMKDSYRAYRGNDAEINRPIENLVSENVKDREVKIAENKGNITSKQSQLSERRNFENDMATQLKNSGGDGTRYNSLREYNDARAKSDIYKKFADYRNFDTKPFVDKLDPSTKAEFYKERAQRQTLMLRQQGNAKALKFAATAGGALIGGTANLYGGSDNVVSGAMMGGMAGGMAGGKLERKSADIANRQYDRGVRPKDMELEPVARPKRVAVSSQHPTYNDSHANTGRNVSNNRIVTVTKNSKPSVNEFEARKAEFESRALKGERIAEQMKDANTGGLSQEQMKDIKERYGQK